MVIITILAISAILSLFVYKRTFNFLLYNFHFPRSYSLYIQVTYLLVLFGITFFTLSLFADPVTDIAEATYQEMSDVAEEMQYNIGLWLTPSPTQTPIPAQVAISPNEIQELINKWDLIYHKVSSTLEDDSSLSLVLTGRLLEQHQNSLAELRRANCYWDFQTQEELQLESSQVISPTKVTAVVWKSWLGYRYCNGKVEQEYTIAEPFTVSYEIINTPDGWQIESSQVVEINIK